MMRTSKALADMTGLAIRTWAVLFCVIVFLISEQQSYGQVLSRPRSTGNDQKNTSTMSSSQKGNDSQAIPWDSFDDRSTKLIRDVMDGKTFFRQMPRQLGHCDAEMYDFMLCHPDVVVELWQLLGVTQISLKETAPNKYLLKEGTATTSQIEVLFKSKNLCVVYASGEYEAPMLPRKIKGDVILLLKSRFGRDKENRPVVQCDLDTYVRIHNSGAEMLAKMLIPVVGKIADSNFEQTTGFVMNISEAAQEDYEPLVGLSQRMQNVRPEVAEEFAFVSEAVFDREVDRYVALASDTQQSVAELAHPTTHSGTEALAMPKYTRQPAPVIVPQKDTKEMLATDDSRLVAPTAKSDDLDMRLIPISTDEIRRDMPQRRQYTTAGTVVQPGESSAIANIDAPTVPPRRLSISNDDRSINREAVNTNEPPQVNRQPNTNFQAMASVPAFGHTTRGERTQSERVQEIVPSIAAPSVKEIVSHDAMTPRIDTTSNPSMSIISNERVMIRSISPTQSTMVSRSISSYNAPTPGYFEQAPVPFGTTLPAAPQQSVVPSSQLPLPGYLPK